MILAGIGGGLFIAPNVASIMNSVPVMRRGVAAGMSSTLFNVGFPVTLGLAFATIASRMPLAVMQAIFAGLPVPQGQLEIGAFMDAFHQIFYVIAAIRLTGEIPASIRRRRAGETGAEAGAGRLRVERAGRGAGAARTQGFVRRWRD